MSKIGCTVQECKYWDNDLCTAEEIQVNRNELYSNRDMEIGSIGETTNTNGSPETQCTTFVPRG